MQLVEILLWRMSNFVLWLCEIACLIDFIFLYTILLFILAEFLRIKMTIVQKKEKVLRENSMVDMKLVKSVCYSCWSQIAVLSGLPRNRIEIRLVSTIQRLCIGYE